MKKYNSVTMKHLHILLFSVFLFFGGLFSSCEIKDEPVVVSTFTQEMLGEYLEKRPEQFSEFVKLLDTTKVMSLVKAYGKYTMFAPDNNAMLAAYRSGTIQFVDEIPVDEAESLLASGELSVVPQFGTYFVCFNCEKAPFDDARVREAFSLVIDRSYIVEKITLTGEVPATGLVCPGISDVQGVSGDDFRTVGGDYYSAAAEDYEANCEKARELLAEAGYPNGEGFPTVEYLYNTGDRHKAIGEALQNMWQTQLGVTVTLNNQEAGVFLETCKNGDYTIARNSWLPDYNDAMSFLDMWLTDGGNNVIHYSSADYDEALEKAVDAADPAERWSICMTPKTLSSDGTRLLLRFISTPADICSTILLRVCSTILSAITSL
ncbi:MAG: hypothetical protein EOM14_07335 [Clostridia bacterium]|nr:hypothetical protein [Clostridia bacterium]